MVAQVTNHDTEYVRRKMKYSTALQYRTLYCDIHNIPYATRVSKPKPVME